MIIVLTFELWLVFFLISYLLRGIYYLSKSDFILSISNFLYMNIFHIVNTNGDWNIPVLMFWIIDIILVFIGCTIVNVVSHEIEK